MGEIHIFGGNTHLFMSLYTTIKLVDWRERERVVFRPMVNSDVNLQAISILFSEIGSLASLELTHQTRLAGWSMSLRDVSPALNGVYL